MDKKLIQILGLVGLILSGVILLQVNTKTVTAQDNKEERCDKLFDCLETFYKECYGDEFLDRYSPKQVDKFGIVNHEFEMLKLDGLKYSLIEDSDLYGYIVIYGGRINKYGEIKERMKRVKGYLINYSKLDEKRVVFVNGGFREKFEFEFWISELENNFPPLTPTIDPEKVVFKGKMKPLPIDLGN